MATEYEPTADERTALNLLADAGRLYDEYLRVTEVGHVAADLLSEDWAPSAPALVPLTFAFRRFD